MVVVYFWWRWPWWWWRWMLQNLLGLQLLANKHSRRYSFPAGTVTLTMNGCTRVIEMPRSHRIACRKPISIENTTMGLNSLVQNTNTGLGLKFFAEWYYGSVSQFLILSFSRNSSSRKIRALLVAPPGIHHLNHSKSSLLRLLAIRSCWRLALMGCCGGCWHWRL